VIVGIYETIRNTKRIREMAYYTCPVKVLRNGRNGPLSEMGSDNLAPGDIVEIPEYLVMPCDMTLLTGSCIVNESMLTGESIPVIKNALPFTNDIYNPSSDSKYTLYAGTKVI
jgi:cation-transporting ATPase 13A3/4/5